jgi:DNA-binding transcriptional LysR family regulator
VSIPADHSRGRELFLRFCEDYPEVRLEVSTSSRHVDLVAEGIDVALRFGAIADTSLVARRLWSTRSIAVATAKYLKKHGTPRRLEDLEAHDCIVGFAGESVPARTWPLRDGGTIPVRVRLACSDLGLRIDAARRGLGIALLPERAIEADLAAKKLRVVLEDVVGTETPASLVFVDREFMPPQVRAFIDRATAFYGTSTDAAQHRELAPGRGGRRYGQRLRP